MPGIERFEKEIPYERILQLAREIASETGMEIVLKNYVTVFAVGKEGRPFYLNKLPEGGNIDSFLYMDGSNEARAFQAKFFKRLHDEYGTRYGEGGETTT
jgi:hypothetical protein